MRYVPSASVAATLRAGKIVEQWFGAAEVDGETIIRFLSIDPSRGAFSVSFSEVLDQGHDEWLDVYAFYDLDEDRYDDSVREFPTAEEAIAYAMQTYGAKPDQFLLFGAIQDDYADYLRALGGRPAPPE